MQRILWSRRTWVHFYCWNIPLAITCERGFVTRMDAERPSRSHCCGYRQGVMVVWTVGMKRSGQIRNIFLKQNWGFIVISRRRYLWLISQWMEFLKNDHMAPAWLGRLEDQVRKWTRGELVAWNMIMFIHFMELGPAPGRMASKVTGICVRKFFRHRKQIQPVGI